MDLALHRADGFAFSVHLAALEVKVVFGSPVHTLCVSAEPSSIAVVLLSRRAAHWARDYNNQGLQITMAGPAPTSMPLWVSEGSRRGGGSCLEMDAAPTKCAGRWRSSLVSVALPNAVAASTRRLIFTKVCALPACAQVRVGHSTIAVYAFDDTGSIIFEPAVVCGVLHAAFLNL